MVQVDYYANYYLHGATHVTMTVIYYNYPPRVLYSNTTDPFDFPSISPRNHNRIICP